MRLSIMGEIDTRVFLYPLMRCLRDFGTVCVITSNKQLSRLIEGEYEGEFRNYHIVISESGSLEETLLEFNVDEGAYDNIIYDNCGATEFDVLFVPLGSYSSDSFLEEIGIIKANRPDTVHIIQYGTPQKLPAGADTPLDIPGLANSEQEIQLDKKGRPIKAKPSKNKEGKDKNKLVSNVKYPTFQEIEDFEATLKFMKVEESFAKLVFKPLQNIFACNERVFIKGVQKVDASSGNIKYKQNR